MNHDKIIIKKCRKKLIVRKLYHSNAFMENGVAMFSGVLNPDFAIDNGIRRKIYYILRQKKVRQDLIVLTHFFHVFNIVSLASRFFISIAKSGLNSNSYI